MKIAAFLLDKDGIIHWLPSEIICVEKKNRALEDRFYLISEK